MGMIRKQVYIEAHQEAALKRLARELGVTEAELIRQGIEGLQGRGPARPDPLAWQKIERYIARRRRRKTAATPRKWTRDELYAR